MDECAKLYIPKRYIVTLLGFLGFLSVCAMRANLSVAVVAMINSTDTNTSSNDTLTECPSLTGKEEQTSTEKYKGEQYNWDTKVKGTILGAFFYGYMITQLPGGYAAEAFGAKWVFGLGVLCASIFSLVTPLITRNTTAFIALRVAGGLVEGSTYPAMSCFISKWVPIYERSRLSTIIYIGGTAGTIVSMPLSGWLCSSDLLDGWPAAFYIFGVVGCTWFFFWSYFVYESPQEHPSISVTELSLFTTGGIPSKKPRTPWKAIFTSIPVWAMVFCHTCYEFGYFLYLTELASFLSTVLHFNIIKGGALSALPYIFQVFVCCLSSSAADKMRKSNILGITTIRKLFTTLGLLGSSCCLVGITLSGCRPWLIVNLLTVGMALNGCIFSGSVITNVDMSPTFAGTLFGIMQTPAMLSGVIGPAVVGYFTADGENMMNWNKVFYVTAGVQIAGAAVFAVFGSAELQPWSSKEIPNNEQELPQKQNS